MEIANWLFLFFGISCLGIAFGIIFCGIISNIKCVRNKKICKNEIATEVSIQLAAIDNFRLKEKLDREVAEKNSWKDLGDSITILNCKFTKWNSGYTNGSLIYGVRNNDTQYFGISAGDKNCIEITQSEFFACLKQSTPKNEETEIKQNKAWTTAEQDLANAEFIRNGGLKTTHQSI
jgi:hypothetical protein